MSQGKKRADNPLDVSRFFSFICFVVAPLMYVYLATNILSFDWDVESINIIMTILLIYGGFAPLVMAVIRRKIVSAYNKGKSKFKSPEDAWSKFSIMQVGVGSGNFAFGLLIYFLSGDIQKMLYFYPIGIVWAIFLWPTRKRYEDFISKIEHNEKCS